MNQREQDNLNARLRARSMNLPRMVRCDHCSMPYYQTSAPHVCAGWVTKENGTMNESEKFITTGVFSHERNTSGNCSVSGCPCRGWSAQESVNEHGHEPVARGGESGRFRISTHQNGYYCVSIPNYHGGEVVKIEEYERLRSALDIIGNSYWSENEPYSERVEHLQQLAKDALNDQKGE